MRNILLICIFTLISVTAFSGNTIIKGQIKDIDSKKPIYGATVNIKLTEGYEFFALTDTMGIYEIMISGEILEKDYDIQISARTYNTVNGVLRVKKNTLGNFFMKLKNTITTDTTTHPFKKDTAIHTSALDGYADNNLVFLIDVSSSMNEQNRLPLLKSAFKILIDNFRPSDRITLITFSDGVKEILPPTSAQNKELILAAINNLTYESSSNGGKALDFAYKSAKSSFIVNGNNKIILATDGMITSGEKDYKKIQKLIQNGSKQKIALTLFLFGNSSDYVTNKLTKLTNNGNGHLCNISGLDTAEKFMLEEAKSVRK